MKRIFALLPLLAALSVSTPAVAQTPLLEIDYQNNPVFHVRSDGTVYMPLGATNGYVLTTDADGYATWQPVAGNGGAVTSDATLTGDGTPGDPLGVAVPLVLTGDDIFGAVQGTNTDGNRGGLGLIYGAFGQHADGHAGYLGGNLYGAYGLHTNGNWGALGGNGVGASGHHDNGNQGWLGSSNYSVYGLHDNNNRGGLGTDDYGVYGEHDNGHQGRLGTSDHGVFGLHDNTNRGWLAGSEYGVYGDYNFGNRGWLGSSTSGAYGEHTNGHFGYLGTSDRGAYGEHDNGNWGALGTGNRGVYSENVNGHRGLLAGNLYGAYGEHDNGHWGALGAADHAGYFSGDVEVTGTLSKGGGAFKIDHPLDPEGQYLAHSFVESPDMMNVYNGNVTTDARGEAVVELPGYFEALNRDFRYGLTVIGTFAQAIVAEEIQGNQFVIRTDQPNVKVSWQVTGIRQDPWAEANRIVVEEAKPAIERDYYLHPELYGQPRERSVAWARDPEGMRAMQERPQRRQAERRQREEKRQQIEQERRRMEAERQRMEEERQRLKTARAQRLPRPDNQP